MTAPVAAEYNVGGVLLAQPFKVRRLGHFGLYIKDMAKARTFYNDLLGFRVSDTAENIARRLPPEALKALEGEADPALFLYHGTDHHSFALFSERMRDLALMRGWRVRVRQTTIQQISWQIGSLAEMVNAVQYCQAREIPIQRTGRDMPGSNWHTYVWDPDDHINEFFYGMEQEGWNRRSKPYAMYDRGFTDLPSLPQISEETELKEAFEKGIDVTAGYLSQDTLPPKYEVEGVILPRPFKVTKVGPAHVFVSDVDRSVRFYADALGFKVTEEVQYRGEKAVYLRAGSEHHSLGLISAGLKGRLGCRPDTSLMAFGLEVATYQQLKDAVGFLKERGVAFKEIPQELHPGIDYAACAQDPEGHLFLLYYYMEQIGWDGRPRPKEQRRKVEPGQWPEALEPMVDTYADAPFMGPLG